LGEYGLIEKLVEPHKGVIEEEQIELLSSFTYRTLQFLSELELFGGEVIAKNPTRLLFQRTKDISMDSSTFMRISIKLAKQGIITIEQVNGYKTLVLTNLGKECIAQLKILPGILNSAKQWPETLYNGTGFITLEYVLENASYSNGDGIRWLREPNSKEPIVPFLATQMGLSHDSMTRRLYALRLEKKYLTEETRDNKTGVGAVITNLGITLEGIAYLERINTRLRDRDMLHDDELVEEIMGMTQTGIELAEETGAKKLASQLREKYDVAWVLGLDKVAFEEHIFWLERIVERLRQDYIFEKSA
jgi:hypothetical protein